MDWYPMYVDVLQYGFSVLFPLTLAVCVWMACRRQLRFGLLMLALFLGAVSVFPVVRFCNLVEPWVGHRTGHFYTDELVAQLLGTALPEEWSKCIVAVLVWCMMGKPFHPLTWACCAAAAHCGFAVAEGLLGAFGNEGLLKVVVGRSLGASHHCSWGIIAAWFAWQGWHGCRFRAGSWFFALLLPSVLHSLSNASMLEIPGASTAAASDTISATELMVVLPGMASLPVSWALAIWCVYSARRIPPPPPILPRAT